MRVNVAKLITCMIVQATVRAIASKADMLKKCPCHANTIYCLQSIAIAKAYLS